MANDQRFQDVKPFHVLKRKIGLAKSNYIEHKKKEVKGPPKESIEAHKMPSL